MITKLGQEQLEFIKEAGPWGNVAGNLLGAGMNAVKNAVKPFAAPVLNKINNFGSRFGAFNKAKNWMATPWNNLNNWMNRSTAFINRAGNIGVKGGMGAGAANAANAANTAANTANTAANAANAANVANVANTANTAATAANAAGSAAANTGMWNTIGNYTAQNWKPMAIGAGVLAGGTIAGNHLFNPYYGGMFSRQMMPQMGMGPGFGYYGYRPW